MRFLFISTRQTPGGNGCASGLRAARTPPLAGKRPAIGSGGGGAAFAGTPEREGEINNQVVINVRVLAPSHPKPWPTTISPLPRRLCAQSQGGRRRALCGSAQHPRQALTTPTAAPRRSGRARLSTASHVETPSSSVTGRSLVRSPPSCSRPSRNRPCSSCVLRGQSVSSSLCPS